MDRQLGDRYSEAHMLAGLAKTRQGQQRHRKAVDLYEQSPPMFHELEHRSSEAETLESLGGALLSQGKRAAELLAWREAQVLYRQLLLAQHVDRVSVLAAQARRLSVLRLAFRRLTR